MGYYQELMGSYLKKCIFLKLDRFLTSWGLYDSTHLGSLLNFVLLGILYGMASVLFNVIFSMKGVGKFFKLGGGF